MPDTEADRRPSRHKFFVQECEKAALCSFFTYSIDIMSIIERSGWAYSPPQNWCASHHLFPSARASDGGRRQRALTSGGSRRWSAPTRAGATSRRDRNAAPGRCKHVFDGVTGGIRTRAFAGCWLPVRWPYSGEAGVNGRRRAAAARALASSPSQASLLLLLSIAGASISRLLASARPRSARWTPSSLTRRCHHMALGAGDSPIARVASARRRTTKALRRTRASTAGANDEARLGYLASLASYRALSPRSVSCSSVSSGRSSRSRH